MDNLKLERLAHAFRATRNIDHNDFNPVAHDFLSIKTGEIYAKEPNSTLMALRFDGADPMLWLEAHPTCYGRDTGPGVTVGALLSFLKTVRGIVFPQVEAHRVIRYYTAEGVYTEIGEVLCGILWGIWQFRTTRQTEAYIRAHLSHRQVLLEQIVGANPSCSYDSCYDTAEHVAATAFAYYRAFVKTTTQLKMAGNSATLLQKQHETIITDPLLSDSSELFIHFMWGLMFGVAGAPAPTLQDTQLARYYLTQPGT